MDAAAVPPLDVAAAQAPSLLELALAVVLAFVLIPTSVCTCLVRRLLFTNPGIPLWRDALMCIVRSSGPLSLAVRRMLLNPRPIASIVNSPHFHPYAGDLCERVQRHDFAGYWVCRGPPGKPQHPCDSDLVVLFIHGGAYALGHPLMIAPQLLCAVERAASENVDVSLFSLHYSLAPETPFPAQFDQCVAAYQYILGELKVEPSRVIIMGESAGGHLALSFFHYVKTLSIPKPGGAFFLYPWVDLSNKGASFATNQYKDMLVKKDLDRAANFVLGTGGHERYEHLINMAAPREAGYWKMTLPQITQVNVGTHDVLLSSIMSFTENAKNDGARIQLELAPEAPHGYTATRDHLDSAAYLRSAPGTYNPSLMKMASMYAKVFVGFANTLNGVPGRVSD